jgi:hypothetical protein
MANVGLKFMLGLFPKTEAIEQKNHELIKEYGDFQEYTQSEELARFKFLDQFINSQEFAQRVQ